MLFSKRSTAFIKYALVAKENEILRRQLEHNGSKVKFNNSDRRFFSFILSLYPRARKLLTLVTPATVLYKWKCIYKKRWTFLQRQKPKHGRPSITMKIRKLILEMKKLNPLWGYRHISGELDKIDIEVSKDTVARVIQKGRKDGDILPTGSWKRFITAHIKSLYCCDFFCIDTVFNKRLYIFFIMSSNTLIINHSELQKSRLQPIPRISTPTPKGLSGLLNLNALIILLSLPLPRQETLCASM